MEDGEALKEVQGGSYRLLSVLVRAEGLEPKVRARSCLGW